MPMDPSRVPMDFGLRRGSKPRNHSREMPLEPIADSNSGVAFRRILSAAPLKLVDDPHAGSGHSDRARSR